MTDINIGYIAEALNNKADRDLENITANVSFVIETWRDGANWYRLYNDGWCEQGGLLSASSKEIVFHKEFADTNYNLVAVPKASSAYCRYDSKTTTGANDIMQSF